MGYSKKWILWLGIGVIAFYVIWQIQSKKGSPSVEELREAAIRGFETASTHLVSNTMCFKNDTMIYKIQYLHSTSHLNPIECSKKASKHLNDILYKDDPYLSAEDRRVQKKGTLRLIL